MTDYQSSIMQEMDYDTFLRMIAKIPSCVYFKDTELRYRFSSHYWAQLNGRDIIGKTDSEIRVDQENVGQAEESDREIMRSGKGCKYEIKCPGPDNNVNYLELNKEPVFDDDGNVLGIVGLINNITEKNLMQQRILEMSHQYENQCHELESANEELKRSLNQIEEFHKAHKLFTTSMNHELRSPLNGISGLLQLLMDDSSLTDEQSRLVTNAYQSSQYMLRIVNDLLEFAKFETDEFKIVPAVFKFDEILSGIEYINSLDAASKGLTFEMNIQDEIKSGEFYGDSIRIKQIITNFVTNSIKYTSSGTVTLTLKYQDGNLVVICADTGQGIPDYAMERLFQPFVRINERINSKVQGTGLGLSIVKKIVEKMNGNLTYDSKINVGTTFTVTVPLDRAEEAATAETEEKDSGKEKDLDFTKLRALCVDDSKISADVMAALLKKLGMQAEAVNSGAAAIEKANAAKYDIIFMDHMMPGMDGVETYTIIRGESVKNADTPIVALTGNAEEGSGEYYCNIGFDGYLVKPVLMDRIGKMVMKLCSN